MQLSGDGEFKRDDWTHLLEAGGRPLLSDQQTGEFRWKGMDDVRAFVVAQQGAPANAMNALRTLQGPALFVHDYLEIQTFQEG